MVIAFNAGQNTAGKSSKFFYLVFTQSAIIDIIILERYVQITFWLYFISFLPYSLVIRQNVRVRYEENVSAFFPQHQISKIRIPTIVQTHYYIVISIPAQII